MALFTTATAAVDNYTFTGDAANTLFLQFQRYMQSGDFFDGGDGIDKIQIRSSMAGEENFDVRGVTFHSFEQLSYYPMSGMDMPGSVKFKSSQFGADAQGNALISNSLFVIGSNYSATDTQKIYVYVDGADSDFSAKLWKFAGWASGKDVLKVYGSSGDNEISGSSMADTLLGSAGDDVLRGNAGNDTLTGGSGQDTMYGSSGRDIFDFNSAAESRNSAALRDFIYDFTRGSDDIDLSSIDASTRVSGNQAFKFISSHQFHKVAGEVHYRYEGTDTVIEGDTNGDAKADFQIELRGKIALSSADFIL